MSTIEYQKERIEKIKQMILDEEHNSEIYENMGLIRKIKSMENNSNLYEELKKEEYVLKVMEEGDV